MAYDDLITGGVRAKLGALKWSLRANLLGGALAWIVLAVVAGVFLTLGIDYALHMDRAQRGLIMALTLAGVGWVTWRFLLRPLRVSMDDEELALVLENHYGDLDDRLISTLQFAAGGDRVSGRIRGSEVLIRKVAEQVGSLMEKLDPRGPVESGRTWRRMSIPAVAVIVLVVFTIFNSSVMGLWFQRNILFADVAWPQETYLTIEGGREIDGGSRLQFRVVRGRSLPITVKADADHVVPNDVTFHMDFPGLGTVAENVAAAPSESNTYLKVFENVSEPFEFYVTGNDDRTRDCRVVVVDPPELLEASFKIDYPVYMNRSPLSVSLTHGVLAIPPGSRVTLAGRANKPLVGARLMLDGKEVGTVRLERLKKFDAPDERRGLVGQFFLPERTGRSSMKLEFELTDTEKIENPRGAVYAIRVEPDRPPSVSMNRIGVRADVTSRATIPLLIQVNDDHGVTAVEVYVTPVAISPTTTAPTTAAVAQKFLVPLPEESTDKKEVHLRYELDLEPMKLKVGRLIRVYTVVRDTLPESYGGPNTGKSLVQAYKIVSDEELQAELLRLRREIRQEFTAGVVLQAEMKAKVRGVADRIASAGVDASVRQDLFAAAANQQRIAAQCAVAAQRLQSVLDEMNYNRVGSPADKRKLAGQVIQKLQEICKKPMIDLGANLIRASKETDVKAARTVAEESVETLNDFCERLEKILEAMIQGENRQELENRLKIIIDIGTKILKEIQEKARKDTGTIFDNTTRPKPEEVK